MSENHQFTTLTFLAKTLAAASVKGVSTFDPDAVNSSQNIRKLVDLIYASWLKADTNGDRQLASDLLAIYCDLGVTTGTSQHDLFATKLRQLQPGYLGVTNPYYQEFRLQAVPDCSPEKNTLQREIAMKAAEILFQAH